ncbi:MAG: LD-carboxypeptidase, partial [Dolichospermum sp.]
AHSKNYKENLNIFVVSPSAPIRIENNLIEYALSKFHNMGLKVTFGSNCFVDSGNTAGTIKQRVTDIHEGFSNPKFDLIMSTQGGFNSNELLPFLDYEMIKNNPKPFCGMSDMTTLCTNLLQKSGIQTFYGLQFRHFTNPDNKDF